MDRRSFVLSSASLALAGPFASSGVQAQATTQRIDVIAAIKALRIPSGPFAGGYEVAPNGRLNWYFTALGLLPIVQWLGPADLETYIRSYLDLYIRSLSAQRTVEDVGFPKGRADFNTFVREPSDSDDSYAATFLSLAARYVRASRNWTWWHANKAVMMEVAYRNLALTAKPAGLTSVFQSPRSRTNSIGYLMDNCEVYRGLRDFGEMLKTGGNAGEGNYYNLLASNTAQGMVKLFNVTTAAFTPGDAFPSSDTSFYPGTTCQVFPEAFGVVELKPLYDRGWTHLNKHSAGWEDGRYDAYPWAVLGFVAAKRGQLAQARTQMAQVERKFGAQRHLVTINELGFYQRMVNILGGGIDV